MIKIHRNVKNLGDLALNSPLLKPSDSEEKNKEQGITEDNFYLWYFVVYNEA
jgi:hypothetical protein